MNRQQGVCFHYLADCIIGLLWKIYCNNYSAESFLFLIFSIKIDSDSTLKIADFPLLSTLFEQ